MQTPATRALADAGIDHRVLSYEHDPAAESYGIEAADALGLDPDQVFKTLLAELDTSELVVAIVPVSCRLDLKSLARLAGAKKAEMADPSRAEKVTGYVVGGISPLGQKKQLRTFVDELAELSDEIFVSAGRRGLDLGVGSAELVAVLDATVGPIAR